MKILGFRSDPNSPRFALIEANGGAFTLLNADTENKLMFPAHCDDEAQRLMWMHQEIERIFHNHPDISRVVIKTNEYTGSESKAKRFSSYVEGVVMACSAKKGVATFIKTYSSLSTKSADVKVDASARVAQTSKGWDNKMADAVVAAWWGGKQ